MCKHTHTRVFHPLLVNHFILLWNNKSYFQYHVMVCALYKVNKFLSTVLLGKGKSRKPAYSVQCCSPCSFIMYLSAAPRWKYTALCLHKCIPSGFSKRLEISWVCSTRTNEKNAQVPYLKLEREEIWNGNEWFHQIFKLPSTDRLKAGTQLCIVKLGIQASVVEILPPLVTSCVTFEKFASFS